MSSPAQGPAESLPWRSLRVIARVGLALIVTFILGLVILVVSAQAQREVGEFFSWMDGSKERFQRLVIMLILGLIIFGTLLWFGRRMAWRRLGIGYALVTPFLVYLAWDDAAVRRSQTLEEFSPVFPGADESYKVLMRYSKNQPEGRNFPTAKLAWIVFDPRKPELWQKFVTENRAEIEAEWQALAPVWAWWNELNTFERIGDLTPPRIDADIMAFQPVRQLSQRACAIATLQALDGRGDEAIATLVPLVEVARKLQPNARTLVRSMIAIFIEKMSVQTAGFVLDHATVSPELRGRLATALAAPGGGEAGARRLMAIEYVFSSNAYFGEGLGTMVIGKEFGSGSRRILDVVSPLVFNRWATCNLYAEVSTLQQDIVGRREMETLKPRIEQFFAAEGRPGFKNPVGSVLLRLMIPAYGKVGESYWKTQDERTVLLARVTTS
jgi:Ca2+/Na+ antiporter